MSEQKFYFRQNVQVEPLINQWYAWPHLLAPATAAMRIANSHVKIMKSFLMTPQIHAAAVKNPAMRGGPFMDLDSERLGAVKELLETTTTEQAHLIQFAEALKQLNDLLINEGKGQSLEPLYEKVPEMLRGYVELVYDLNHRPSFRLLEGLLYESPYYDVGLQSIALSLTENDERPFVFSTPRIPDAEHLHLKIPFNHPAIDELCRMRDVPRTFAEIKQVLGFDDAADELFRTFLTTEPPARHPRYTGERPRVRYLGHACLLIETKDVSILTDPLISYDYESEVFRYGFSALPEKIDYVLITHSHSDHIVFESLLQLRHKIGTVIVPRSGSGSLEDPSLKAIVQHLGFERVLELDEMESIPVPGGSIIGLPFLGEHGELNVRSKIAHLVRLGEASVLCAADSRNIEPRLYERLHELVGDIDTLFIGMECDGAPLSWLYGPLLLKPLERKMDQSRRFSGSDFTRAFDIVKRFNCRRVYVYAMGQEPWLSFITSIKYTEQSNPIVESNKLIEACRGLDLEAERLFAVKEILL